MLSRWIHTCVVTPYILIRVTTIKVNPSICWVIMRREMVWNRHYLRFGQFNRGGSIRSYNINVNTNVKYKISQTVSVLNQAPCHEVMWRNGGIAPRILNLSTIWSEMLAFRLSSLIPTACWIRLLVGLSAHFVGEKDSLDPAGNWNKIPW